MTGCIYANFVYQIPGAPGRNPLVYGRFSARRSSNVGVKKIPTVLVYGHYDVIFAQNDDNQWLTDPFKLTGRDGYLYGRGTSDNKVTRDPILGVWVILLTWHIVYRALCFLVSLLFTSCSRKVFWMSMSFSLSKEKKKVAVLVS